MQNLESWLAGHLLAELIRGELSSAFDPLHYACFIFVYEKFDSFLFVNFVKFSSQIFFFYFVFLIIIFGSQTNVI